MTNKEIREIFAIAGGQITEGPTWDKIKSAGGKLAQKITTKQVSVAALQNHWNYVKTYDSGLIAKILRSNNVSDSVIKDIFDEMNIEIDTPASGGSQTNTAATGTAAPDATAAQPAAVKSITAAPAMDTNQILKSYETMTPEQRKQLIKNLEIIDDRDRPFTYPAESLKRQRKI